jgi:hypothetical protein
MQDHPSPSATTPAPDPLTYPDPPARVAAVATIQSVITDAADLITRPKPGEAEARVADRLAEELAEAAAMLRALPARPRAMSGHDYALLAALRTARAAGEDVGETIARALARLAAELGGSFEVLKAWPGSWEAATVAELTRGTLGPDDENLSIYGGPGGSL